MHLWKFEAYSYRGIWADTHSFMRIECGVRTPIPNVSEFVYLYNCISVCGTSTIVFNFPPTILLIGIVFIEIYTLKMINVYQKNMDGKIYSIFVLSRSEMLKNTDESA